MEKQIRNYGPLPFLEREGLFIKEIPINKWVRPPQIKREAAQNEKVTRHKNSSVSNIKKDGDEKTENGFPSIKQPNKIKSFKEDKINKQKEESSSEEDKDVDLRKNPNWSKGLLVWQRLFAHHTLSSIRRSVTFVSSNVPRDKLDFVLDSTYRHETAVFPETTDVYLQPETLGCETWRVLRNNKHIPPPGVISRGHPIRFGGMKLRPNIYNVKLGIPAPHVAQTNAGYSRREDGALYKV